MGEFLAAALLVCGLWILCDLGKVWMQSGVPDEKKRRGDPGEPADGPGREQMTRVADAFQALADTMSGLPCRRERLGEQDLEEIYWQMQNGRCSRCRQYGECWEKRYEETRREIYGMLMGVEEGACTIEGACLREPHGMNEWNALPFWKQCSHPEEFFTQLQENFHQAMLKLLWDNRMLEQRKAMGEQLTGTAGILRLTARRIFDARRLEGSQGRKITAGMQRRGIQVRHIWAYGKDEQRKELFLDMRLARGSCLPVKEAARLLSEVTGQPMMPARDSRMTISGVWSTAHFVTEPPYYMLFGMAKMTKEGEVVSGDSYVLLAKEGGQVVMSLSDGMGSGLGASKESETVVGLLEQLLEAGFAKETAVRLINSVMVLQNQQLQMYSTIDLCVVDLFEGSCELLKVGAAATFIKSEAGVEAVASTSLPMGMMQTMDYDRVFRKLESGDRLIMMTDGVLDTLEGENREEIMAALIAQIQTANSSELARRILERTLEQGENGARDDMTILVGGIWKKAEGLAKAAKSRYS